MLEILKVFVSGLCDSLNFGKIYYAGVKEKRIFKRLFHCILLNGLVYLGSIYLYEYVIENIILFILDLPFGSKSSEWSIFMLVLYFLFVLFWISPIYIATIVLNTIWYQQIADSCWIYLHSDVMRDSRTQDSHKATNNSVDSVDSVDTLFQHLTVLLKNVSDLAYSHVVSIALIIQSKLVSLIPLNIYVPTFLSTFSSSLPNSIPNSISLPLLVSLLLTAWSYAYCCFEYRWTVLGLPLETRLDTVENDAWYYLGFGLPLTLSTSFLPTATSLGLFSLVFPFFVVTALLARTPDQTREKVAVKPALALPVFHVPVFRLIRLVLDLTLLRLRNSFKASPSNSTSPTSVTQSATQSSVSTSNTNRSPRHHPNTSHRHRPPRTRLDQPLVLPDPTNLRSLR